MTWGEEPVTKEKLDQMANNDQWLFENNVRMLYNGYGVKKPSGVKIMAAILIIGAVHAVNRSGTFNFGSFFTSGCMPIITTAMNPVGGNGTSWGFDLTIKGIGMATPDYRGFVATIYSTPTSNADDLAYVHFMAMGW